MLRGKLVLEDGAVFHGYSFGSTSSVAGEVVFATGMVGYPQSMSDPSYRGQILVFTYPLIGNYGVPGREKDRFGLERHFESGRVQVSGIIVDDYSEEYSSCFAEKSLGEWLRESGVPGLCGIDTRALTKKLREKGVMLGKIIIDKDVGLEDPNKRNLVAEVSTKKVVEYKAEAGKARLCVVDCGCKNSIIRELLARGADVVRVPFDHEFSSLDVHGFVVSNGPGDPKMCRETVRELRRVMEKKLPVFGICLGNQLLALASGANTYKLRYGHRSQNQPCLVRGTRKCFITSQNHGYAVDASSLAKEWEEWFTNLNDNTNEGIRHRSLPFMSVQFHPEAAPGPKDTVFLFDEFIKLAIERSGRG